LHILGRQGIGQRRKNYSQQAPSPKAITVSGYALRRQRRRQRPSSCGPFSPRSSQRRCVGTRERREVMSPHAPSAPVPPLLTTCVPRLLCFQVARPSSTLLPPLLHDWLFPSLGLLILRGSVVPAECMSSPVAAGPYPFAFEVSGCSIVQPFLAPFHPTLGASLLSSWRTVTAGWNNGDCGVLLSWVSNNIRLQSHCAALHAAFRAMAGVRSGCRCSTPPPHNHRSQLWAYQLLACSRAVLAGTCSARWCAKAPVGLAAYRGKFECSSGCEQFACISF
jgi:hypothetical protein